MELLDSGDPVYQHVLMTEVSEDFDIFLSRITRKLVRRLIVAEGLDVDVLSQIKMTARLMKSLDRQLHVLIATGDDRYAGFLLDELLIPGPPYERPTWKEVGEALGVSAQAAHRKYGSSDQKSAKTTKARPATDEQSSHHRP